jgi:DNA primase
MRPPYPVQQDFAQTVKQQADIVRIIGDYVRLKKSGAQNFSGLCPFYSEKSPSFSVHAVRQFYHCFGCGESGDVFSFVEKIENVGFAEAIKIVAQKCGIPLPKREYLTPEEAAESRQRGKLLELHELATAWFEEQLRTPAGAKAREYLTGRGLTPEAIQKFRIGYAPDSFNAMRTHMERAADPQLLRLSGLFSSKEQANGTAGGLYARFRQRITFPIQNESGRVIAFTARALDANENAGPKYMNSPETPLYSKGQVLFNLDKARQPIRQLDFAVLVEGQMDCISAYMAGVQNVLATSGTAFTAMQVHLLSRYTKRVAVNFDPDTAGANAAEKSIALLTEEDFEVKVVTLEGGLDPDRFIRERGVRAYMAALTGGKRHPEYLIGRAQQLFPGRTAESKNKALNYLLPHIRRLPNRIARDEFAADTAQRLGIDSALVREELKQAARMRREQVRSPQMENVNEAERLLLRALSSAPESTVFVRAAEGLRTQPECFEHSSVSRMFERLRDRPAAAGDPLTALVEPGERTLLAGVLLRETGDFGVEEVEAALHTLKYRHLEGRQRRLRAEIAEAERSGDWAQVAAIAAEKLRVDREMREGEPAATP